MGEHPGGLNETGRLSAPSSLEAHHRRLMASCAESGCPQVRQRSGALPSNLDTLARRFGNVSDPAARYGYP